MVSGEEEVVMAKSERIYRRTEAGLRACENPDSGLHAQQRSVVARGIQNPKNESEAAHANAVTRTLLVAIGRVCFGPRRNACRLPQLTALPISMASRAWPDAGVLQVLSRARKARPCR